MDVCCRYEHEALQNDPCHICYPGVVETIRKLSGQVKVFIVSNCQSGYIELFLKKDRACTVCDGYGMLLEIPE